jgi:hypothetical protein
MTIKKSAANEILTSMATQLKVASVAADFKRDLKNAKTEAEVDAVRAKYNKRALLMEGVDAEALCNARKGQIKKEKNAAMGFAIRKIIEAADVLDEVGLEMHAKGVDALVDWLVKR